MSKSSAADNIPGVPGIGEKTAKKLVKLYDSVEGLLANTHKLKGKQKENVINNKEQALLSKELVKIILDVPCDVSFDSLKINDYDEDKIKSLFTEFEFNSLGKRLFGGNFESGRGNTSTTSDSSEAEIVQADLKSITDFNKKYTLVNTEEALQKLVKNLQKQDTFCFDLETTSLNPRLADILGIALSWKSDEAYFISTREQLSLEKIVSTLEPVFTSNKTKIGHNLKFDISVLLGNQIKINGPYFDTMLAHSLTHPEHRHNMDYVAETLLGYTTIKLADLAQAVGDDDLFTLAEKKNKKDKKDIDMSTIPTEQLSTYACEDADITFQLTEIESPLLPVLTKMEMQGISIHSDSLSSISNNLGERIEKLKISITEQVGKEFNLNSPKQLGEILFDELKLVEKPKTTKTGQYKTDESTLSALAPKHAIVAEILDYRESAKLKSTYVDALPSHLCSSDGRIHTHFHQLITSVKHSFPLKVVPYSVQITHK